MQTGPQTPAPLWLRLIVFALIMWAVYVMLNGWDRAPGFWSEQFDRQTKDFSAEVVAYADTLPQITLPQLNQQFNTPAPSLVFVFASWCPHCRRVMPELVGLSEAVDLPLTVISVDKNRYQLADYWLSQPDAVQTLPMQHMPAEDTARLNDFLKAHGGDNAGAIPYLAVVNEDGKVIAEILGYASKDALITQIKLEGMK